MEPEVLQPHSSPFYNIISNSILDHDHVKNYGSINGCEISSSFTTTEDSSEISCFSTLFSSDYFVQFAGFENEILELPAMEDFSLENLEGFVPDLGDPFGSMYESDEGSFIPPQQVSTEREEEDIWSPTPSIRSSEASVDTTVPQPSLTLPGEDMEIDRHLGVLHLLKAYGEAMENGQRELAEVILRCVREKVSPVGEALERVAFILSQDVKKQGDYMKQECAKNFEAAFRVIYQLFPYGRFTHFAANSAILDAMPDDAETVHIVDFDIGEGVQWPVMIEALAQRQKSVKLTAIKWGEDYNCTPQGNFPETKRWLCDRATSCGMKLKMEEMTIEDLVSKMKKMKKKREWLAFNCTVGLPHMGRERSGKLVKEFLQMANCLLTNFRGIITFGHGDACETLKDCSIFGSFFSVRLAHYQALLESMESNFPAYLGEARMAMECLFVAPYISSHAWFQKWEEMREGFGLPAASGSLEGCRVSHESLMEAKELVKDGASLYGVKIGGESENKIVLEWNGTPLVMVSTWRSQS